MVPTTTPTIMAFVLINSVSGFSLTDTNNLTDRTLHQKSNTWDSEQQYSKGTTQTSLKNVYEQLRIICDQKTLENRKKVNVLCQMLTQLDWRTLVVIHDAQEDLSLTFLSDKVTSAGIKISLFTYADDMIHVFTKFSSYQNILVLCSSTCTASIMEQASNYTTSMHHTTRIRYTTKWLVLIRIENSLYYDQMRLTQQNYSRNTKQRNLTLDTGVLDNVAVISVSPGTGQSYANTVEVHTSFRSVNGRYWRKVALEDSTSSSLACVLYPNINAVFNGRHFRVGTLRWRPFIIKSDNTYSGFCVDILNVLKERLNFTYEFVEPDDHEYGIEVNGTWSGLIGQLVNKEVDMVMTDIVITHEREQVVDFTNPFLMDTATIVVRHSVETQGNLWIYYFPLRLEVYLCVVSTFVVVFTVVAMGGCFAGHNSSNPSKGHRLCDSFWYLIGVPFRQGNDEIFSGISVRPVVGSWWVLTFLVTAVYTGNIIAFLTVSNDEPPFDTALQMATETNFKWGCVRGASYLNLFKRSNLTVYKLLLEGILIFNQTDPDILSEDQDIHFQKLLTEEYAYIGGKPVVQYWMEQECQLRTLKDSFFPVKYSMAFPHGSPYKEVFSEMILQLVNSGIIDRLKQTWWPKDQCKQEKTKPQAVTLSVAQAAFYAAASGVALGTLVLIAEKCWDFFSSAS